MLPRVLEPEVMDTEQEALDYDTMDHGSVNEKFLDDLLEEGRLDHWTLDLGTGTAQIPIALCRRIPEVCVVGVDLAESMLAQGRKNVEAAGFADRVRLELADAKALPYPDGSFGSVMSNSIIHHIPEPRDAFAELRRVTASEGYLFLRDLLRPWGEPEVKHLVETYAADCNSHQRMLFENSLRAALTLDEVRALVKDLGFPPSTVKQTSDRHWTWSAHV